MIRVTIIYNEVTYIGYEDATTPETAQMKISAEINEMGFYTLKNTNNLKDTNVIGIVFPVNPLYNAEVRLSLFNEDVEMVSVE